MDLLKNIWVQTGFVGLFSITGWAVVWFLWKDNRLMRQTLLTVVKENTEAITKLAERIK